MGHPHNVNDARCASKTRSPATATPAFAAGKQRKRSWTPRSRKGSVRGQGPSAGPWLGAGAAQVTGALFFLTVIVMPDLSFVATTDMSLVTLINSAKQRLVVVAPALRIAVANAVVGRWRALGPANVTVILDAAPDAIRVGVGDLAALELLEQTARELDVVIHRKAGLWIGVVLADNRTLVFSPTPALLAVAGLQQNGLSLDGSVFHFLPQNAGKAINPDASQKEVINQASIEKVKADLATNPPQPIAAEKVIRVFNAFFEFVELKLVGTALERKSAHIPSELLGLANSKNLRERMHASFRLIGEEDMETLSGRHLDEFKKAIVREHLIALKDYGNVVLRSCKPDFERQVKELEAKVNAFRKAAEDYLQRAIDRNRKLLMADLLPAVKQNPPRRWKRFGANLDDAAIGQLLDDELQRAFGTAKHRVGEMKVKCVFKGVTYELLSDPAFLEAAKAIPTFAKLYLEFDAVKLDTE